MSRKILKGLFPNLQYNSNTITSDPDINYNCVAWVLHCKTKWIDTWEFLIPPPPPVYIWPKGLPRDSLPETYIDLFKIHGFEETDKTDGTKYEEGNEKIVLYTHKGEFRHVALLLPNNLWSSKLGEIVDIQHRLKELYNDLPYPYNYGEVSIFMRRNIQK